MPKDKIKSDQAAAPTAAAAKSPLVYIAEGVTQIGASPYYILPDGSVARRLKPTLINGTPYYNLCIGKAGKTMRTRHDKLQEFAQAYAELTAAKAAQPNA
jgi:hypothetical protein